jgi:hypothetical protein
VLAAVARILLVRQLRDDNPDGEAKTTAARRWRPRLRCEDDSRDDVDRNGDVDNTA